MVGGRWRYHGAGRTAEGLTTAAGTKCQALAPLIGNLFKSENRACRKTNLMLFLRPVIIP